MLKGGHADNALRSLPRPRLIAGSCPGSSRRSWRPSFDRWLGRTSRSCRYRTLAGRRLFPLREDVVNAYTKAVKARFPNQTIIPQMSTGASDGLEFRARGIPVYGVDGQWGVSPDDERAHGKDERIPVQSLWDNVLHWESMVRDLAGGRVSAPT